MRRIATGKPQFAKHVRCCLIVTSGAHDPGTFREPDGIALNQTGRSFVTANEGDTRNASGGSGVRGGRTVSVFDARTGKLLGDTGSQLDDAEAGAYDDSRSNRGGSEPEVLDLAQHRGVTLVAVGLERANAVALIDTSDPATPTVVDIAPGWHGSRGDQVLPPRQAAVRGLGERSVGDVVNPRSRLLTRASRRSRSRGRAWAVKSRTLSHLVFAGGWWPTPLSGDGAKVQRRWSCATNDEMTRFPPARTAG